MSSSTSRNIDESCHLAVWLFQDNAPLHKSLVAQQALCDCEFVQLDHPAYSPDLAPSDHFVTRNLKYHLSGTWFTDDKSLKIAVEAWFESQNRTRSSAIALASCQLKSCQLPCNSAETTCTTSPEQTDIMKLWISRYIHKPRSCCGKIF